MPLYVVSLPYALKSFGTFCHGPYARTRVGLDLGWPVRKKFNRACVREAHPACISRAGGVQIQATWPRGTHILI